MTNIMLPAFGKSTQTLRLAFAADPRHYQILFLSSFLTFGLLFLSWPVQASSCFMAFSGCLITQLLLDHVFNRSVSGVKSALISSLSLCLMLKSDHPEVFFLAGVISMASKFFISRNDKHMFNPTNFGIILTILLTGKAWVSPGQWGSDAALLFFTGLAGLVVLLRVNRLETGFVFLGVFLALGFIYNILWKNWPVDFFFHQLSSGTLLLFSFFMITDPRATPNHRMGRIIFASAVAVLAFVIQIKMFRHDAPLWALFALSPFCLLLDYFFQSPSFKWNQK